MSMADAKNGCREATEYYYDLLHHHQAGVPEQVRRHIEACASCRERMRFLAEALAGNDDETDGAPSPEDRKAVEALGLHLALMDEQVTCAQVKTFLPGLLEPAPEVRIPTPVTVHLDHCPRCVEDLEALRVMHLTAGQLERLSRLYGPSGGRSSVECQQAQAAIEALASFTPAAAEASILDHISTCSSCQAELYRRREQLWDTSLPNARNGAAGSCPDIPAAELFDFVVPFGMTAGDGERVENAGTRAAHVRTCPPCAEKVRMLHRTVYGIAERPDSAVATVYHTEEEVAVGRAGGADTASRFPVQVQVLYREPEPIPGEGVVAPTPARMRIPGLARMNVRTLAKVALIAAAVIVVLTIHFTRGPTATGTDISEALKALENTSNIYMADLARGRKEPYNEVWVARRLNLLAQKETNVRTLYDLKARTKRIIRDDPWRDQTIPLTPEEYAGLTRSIADSVGPILTNLKTDVKLEDVTAAQPPADDAERLTVYELTLTESGQVGAASPTCWRVFIDSVTGLPRRTEFSTKRPPANEWVLQTTKTFAYPTEAEVKSAIRAMFPEP